MIQAVHGRPTKYVRDMGLVWAEKINNTHKLPITRQLWVVFLRVGSFMSVLSVFLFRVKLYTYHLKSEAVTLYNIFVLPDDPDLCVGEEHS